MTPTPCHPALPDVAVFVEHDAATAILRMLTSDQVEPAIRCRADDVDTHAGH